MDKATQNKRKKDTSYHPETHVRDVNSRDIFKNNIDFNSYKTFYVVAKCNSFSKASE